MTPRMGRTTMTDAVARPWVQRLVKGESPGEADPVSKVPLKADERREHARTPLLVGGMIYCGTKEYPCLVDNVSAGGLGLIAKGELDDPGIVSGAVLAVRVDGYGVLAGVVAWRNDNRLGIRFLNAPDQTADQLGLKSTNPAVAKSTL